MFTFFNIENIYVCAALRYNHENIKLRGIYEICTECHGLGGNWLKQDGRSILDREGPTVYRIPLLYVSARKMDFQITPNILGNEDKRDVRIRTTTSDCDGVDTRETKVRR